jgi:UDP-N-acetyl-D-glucosamine dehydrogenase
MNSTAKNLLSKIHNGDALVGIIGLGYVGLPLALAFTEKGFRVIGFDTDPVKIDKLERGECYIKHLDPTRLHRAIGLQSPGGEEGKSEIPNPKSEIPEAAADAKSRIKNSELRIDDDGNSKLRIENSKLFEPTSNFTRLSEPDAILICVPTPLGAHKEPDLTYVEASAQAIRAALRPGQLVILESTTYPGTTDDLLKPILESPTSAEDMNSTADSPPGSRDGYPTTTPQPPYSPAGEGELKTQNSKLKTDVGAGGKSEIRNSKSTQGRTGNSKLKTQN